jgi:hypothetical protein
MTEPVGVPGRIEQPPHTTPTTDPLYALEPWQVWHLQRAFGALTPGDHKLRAPVDYLVPAFQRLAAACHEYTEAWQ